MIHPMSYLSFCEAERAWLVATIEALVRLESPSTDKEALDRCGEDLERRLSAIGGRVQRLPQLTAGNHLRAEFGDGAPQVLVLCHFDTVWNVGQIRQMPVRLADGLLYGPGVYDMKAGIAIGLLAARAIRSAALSLPGRLVMLLTSDEETGSDSSRAIIEDEARRSLAVLVLEPSLPGGAVKTQRKGCGEYLLRVRGLAAHAGLESPPGSSAIHELARQIQALESIRDHQQGITLNVGTIGGGTRTNVVAAEAWAGIDVRVQAASDVARIDAAIQGLRTVIPGTSLEVTGAIDRPPMERSPAVVSLYEQARVVAAALGRTLGEGSTGGGSDGNFTAALGVPTLDGLGAVGSGAHALNEHVVVDQLPWRAALVAGLVERILNGARP